MKLVALVPNNTSHASTWWRIQKPFEMLLKRGHTVGYYHEELIEEAPVKDSIVIIHQLIPSNPKEYIARLYERGAISVLYSIDDYTTEGQPLRAYLDACGGMTHAQIDIITDRIPKQLQTMNLCKAVLTSTQDLANLISDQISCNLIVLPNALDVDWYLSVLDNTAPYRGHSSRTFIGWAGGRRPESDLADMAEAWSYIARDYPETWFVVAGFQHDIIDRNIPLERKIRIPWATLTEWPKSMQVDIGCCALARTKFNIGKSPIKYFEYSMSGAAVVASPTIYEKEIVQHVTGYIARNVDEWYEYLSLLIAQKDTRKRLVTNAQSDIIRFRGLKPTIEQWEYYLGLYDNDENSSNGSRSERSDKVLLESG